MDAVQRVGSQIAMHLVAAKPLYLTKEDATSDALGNERDILKSQVPAHRAGIQNALIHFFSFFESGVV